MFVGGNKGLCSHFYHSPTKLWESNVFTGVCVSKGGVVMPGTRSLPRGILGGGYTRGGGLYHGRGGYTGYTLVYQVPRIPSHILTFGDGH